MRRCPNFNECNLITNQRIVTQLKQCAKHFSALLRFVKTFNARLYHLCTEKTYETNVL